MKLSLRRRTFRVGLVAMVTVVLAGIAYATIPDSSGIIHACYMKSGDALRVIDAGVTSCKQGETELTWNQQGLPGPAGATGPQGPQGPQGPAGISLFANVDQFGTLEDGTATSASRTSMGHYTLTFSQDVSHCAAVATPGSTRGGTSRLDAWPNVSLGLSANDIGVSFNRPDPTTQVANVDTDFHVIVVC